jgi:cell division septum initiation protein DivIVA
MARIAPLVTPTPSHIVHRVVGVRICGFSSEEIDRLVDEVTWVDVKALERRRRSKSIDEIVENYAMGIAGFPRPPITIVSDHDLSRISCRELLDKAKEVVTKFGEKGLCYYILHHYLDKFERILSGQILNRYGHGVTAEDIPDAVKHLKELIAEGYELESSSINALILIFEKGVRTELDFLNYEDVIYERLRKYRSRSTRRNKRRMIEALWLLCIRELRRDDEQLAKSIVKIAIDLRNRIAENAEWILCTIYRYEGTFPGLEKQLNKEIINALKQALKCG